MSQYPRAVIEEAKKMRLAGVSVADIANQCKVSTKTIYNWETQEKWKPTNINPLNTARIALNESLKKPNKIEKDWQEIQHYTDVVVKLEEVANWNKKVESERAIKLETQQANKGKRKSKKQKNKPNQIDHITEAQFKEYEEEHLYEHQRLWIRAGEDPLTQRLRIILKSRQIGATRTFAYEAFKTAVLKGHDQIFISATKRQALVFRKFVKLIARQHFDVEIKGNPVELSNGAELHFISPTLNADSHSGDVYFDEIFKTQKFDQMEEMAQAMATLSQFKKTYFSTPTSVSHSAYPIWSGERYTETNKGIEIDVENLEEMRHGRLDEDCFWRCVTTIHDALDMGYDLTNLAQLKRENPDPMSFAMLYECTFVNDYVSVFKLDDLLHPRCAVDPKEAWSDFDPDSDRPIGNTPVALGYDIAGQTENSDDACVSIGAIPSCLEEPFRLLSQKIWRRSSAPEQVEDIKSFKDNYNFEHLEIDNTGAGWVIGDYLEKEFPILRRGTYTPEYKSIMVQKLLTLIKSGRFQYDKNNKELPLALMTIKPSITKYGRLTYYSDRSKKSAHGDRAWSLLHMVMAEDLIPEDNFAIG